MTPGGLAVLIFLAALFVVLGAFAWILDFGSRRDDREES